MFYCEGKACQKRDKCVWHNIEKHPDISKHTMVQYIDQSLNGAGGYSDGHSWTTWNCGDNGDYKLFEPILSSVDKDMLDEELDNWGISLYHRDGTEKSQYELLYDILVEIRRTITKNENQ